MLCDEEIVARFLDASFQVTQDVVDFIKEQDDPTLIDRIIAGAPTNSFVIDHSSIPPASTPETPKKMRDGIRFLADPEIEVLQGKENTAKGIREFEEYVNYFKDRYTKLSAVMRSRIQPIPIEALGRNGRYREEEISFTGMVSDIRNSAKGNKIVELEDPTATMRVLFNRSRDGFEEAEKLLPDEVIGVKGKLSNDGNIFFADNLIRPDIPINNAPFRSERPGKAVLISDVHVGSDTFLEDAWHRFADWLSDQDDVGYLLVAGDMVDGIGIYPNQDKELVITNIYEQYRAFGEMLAALPQRIKIVLSPGNHDVVRGAEPQPAIPPEFRDGYPPNCIWVENPAMVLIQGVRVLMYHGRSYDDMIGMIPGASYRHPEEIMEEMLKRRHLAPTYGLRTPIAPGRDDRLVIDPVPEVLHTGHVHISGIKRYRGVLMVNAGTWQSQTAFQKQMNLVPTPAQAVVLDLQSLEPEVFDFSGTPP
ncbi:DNA-directed DNA polymerase II small subunit [Methanofollis aquaemaris]|uniref:DNA polymerase II small subunit n=1 Tax=Methanofollis aquaemaris TaxID=126734 RepID=A0A8A3S5C9_9EURY|nr:DNA-directed DNA polymerase II small subunit [Methanofollis aquaemaris]QSZ67467.1 DNA-directed DNA polymerase II small subunit [Methanofollis aquaemaris]